MKKEFQLGGQLAPCGMPCALCHASQRIKNPCPGCRVQAKGKPAHCKNCEIFLCTEEKGIRFCCDCDTFPCKRLSNLDSRYRKGYGVSLITLQVQAKEQSEQELWQELEKNWRCPACGQLRCIHTKNCLYCNK